MTVVPKIIIILQQASKQWGSFPAANGNTITVSFAVSFATTAYALIVSGCINSSAVTRNTTKWSTTDTNVGDSAKVAGWYIAAGK